MQKIIIIIVPPLISREIKNVSKEKVRVKYSVVQERIMKKI